MPARFRSIRDWQTAGVTLTVELATDGELVLGGKQTDFPLSTGGPNGVPFGWQPFVFGETIPTLTPYTFNTSANLFQVSAASLPVADKQAGAYIDFPLVPGYKYRIMGQARRMDSKAPSIRSLALYRSNAVNGTYTYHGGTQNGTAQDDWEDINIVSLNPVPANYKYGRLMASGSDAPAVMSLWGVEFRNLSVMQIASTPPAITWRDITCDVRSVSWRYGRERFTNRFDVGTMQLELRNDDGEYTYSRFHPFGLRPGRQVRVIATYDGVDYPQAFMILDSINEAYGLDGHVMTQWQCVDPTTVLSNQEIASGSTGIVLTSGQRIQYAIDQVGYPYTIINVGAMQVQNIVASGRSVRDDVGVTSDSEGGSFFADRDGNLVFRPRDFADLDENWRTVTAELLAAEHDGPVPVVDDVPTLEDAPTVCLRGLNTDWSLARVINIVELANAGSTVRTYVDEASLKAHGPHTYQRHDFVLTNDDNLDIRANDLMEGYADPVLRVNSVVYAPGVADAWEWTLRVFLNWMVRVWYTHPLNQWGFAVCVHVQSVEHRITPNDWETSMSVDVPESFVELQWSTVGWDTGRWNTARWDDKGD